MLAIALLSFTLVAFAANSILCRLALAPPTVDPISFTTIRLLSGALLLSILVRARRKPATRSGSWSSALALFAYASAFSIAYISLSAGTGALILFGAVQLTMIVAALREGESLRIAQWLGVSIALGGLVWLVMPGLRAPDPLGAAFMLVSGVAWGVYSLRGRNALDPVAMTADNFLRTVPLALLMSLVAFSRVEWHLRGVILAILSGAITSGLGYVLWYHALREITTSQASVVQLLVPVLATFGGVLFLGESLTMRLTTSTVLILAGVALAVRRPHPTAEE